MPLAIELKVHHQAFRRVRRQRRRRSRRRARRDPRAHRRERRRQDDADEHPVRPAAAGRGRDLDQRQAGDAPNPAGAIAAGIGMVHQHFKLVPSLTVAENVFLGMEIRQERADRPRCPGREDRGAVQAVRPAGRSRPSASALLSVGIEQRIEILKVLVRGAPHHHPRRADRRAHAAGEPRALSRPCAASSPQGMTVIFISHHLEEVMEVSDMVTVLRLGKEVATRPTASLEEGRARADDGRPLGELRSPPAPTEQRRAGAPGARPLGARRPPAAGAGGRVLRRQGGRDRRHRRRRRQRPDRARRGHRRSAPCQPRLDHARRQVHRRAVCA